MRIGVDLDGVICTIKKPDESYADVKPIPGVVEKLTELRNNGHTIIINTARNMKTCEHNVGKVMKNVGLITLQWLEDNKIPYDEIFFGKPNTEVYIDDRCIRFSSWDEITEEAINENARSR